MNVHCACGPGCNVGAFASAAAGASALAGLVAGTAPAACPRSPPQAALIQAIDTTHPASARSDMPADYRDSPRSTIPGRDRGSSIRLDPSPGFPTAARPAFSRTRIAGNPASRD
ncbi:hypothetical protein OV079_26225 [Nannocystis pusilla]|uniref:Uncharacterized protein n=1 Tax=Nannocystis pusilla TaxID=889268 RepID=A0A9X3ERW5_9BACT|nr:hypothetical protein [Nannocystis pusilla]MCY1008992.1 hypothetical protein [Nannocystis pusilla]